MPRDTVYDTGNAILAGSLTQNSDQRLKTNIQSLDASSSLAAINALNPVTFNWIDTNKGITPQLGFIAQQVLPIFPNLVATTSPTPLTPDGTLGLNYVGFIAPIVKAMQAVSAEIASLENAISGFADSFTTKELTFTRATGNEIDVHKLCVTKSDGTAICVTGDQLAAVLAATRQQPAASTPLSAASSTSAGVGATSSPALIGPPVISVNGNNPAIVAIGASYSDLGATITGPQQDLNLGITTYLNGAAVGTVALDTSTTSTSTIDYVVTDQFGTTATATRTVIVQ